METIKMRNVILSALLAVALAACGGDEDAFSGGTGDNGGGTQEPGVVAGVASVNVVTDTPSILSDGSVPANISVYVRNSANQFISGVPVTISSDGGGITIVSATTDAAGVAKATLGPAGDPSSRTITVTATAGDVTATTTVEVQGSLIDIQGPASLIQGAAQDNQYTLAVTDSGNKPIAGAVVELSTQPAATLSPTAVTTSANGTATFSITPTTSETLALTARSLGVVAVKSISVSADKFEFSAPTDGTAVAINTNVILSVEWISAGSGVTSDGTAATDITFSTTRGSIVSETDPISGVATVTVASASAGEAVVTANNGRGGVAQRRITFVATTPASIDLQANPFTIAVNQTSTITAVVRDASNNLVAGKAVEFLLAQDPTGGTLSPATAVTDSQGRARTTYSASSTSSATNGVQITASVLPDKIVTDTANLTVAGSALFLTFGTGNSIGEQNNDTQYKIDYIVQVTDSTGAGVAGAPVSIAALSWEYAKGYRVSGTPWTTTHRAQCTSEDRITGNPAFDFNGVVDPGENQNGTNPTNGMVMLEPGNVVTVSPGTGTTDSSGFFSFSVVYPQEYADYVSIVLRARTAVQGTEFGKDSQPFWLPYAADDFDDPTEAPPGLSSPFGTGTTCSDYQ